MEQGYPFVTRLLANDGTGAFTDARAWGVYTSPSSIAVDDLDRDEDLDVVVGVRNNVALVLRNFGPAELDGPEYLTGGAFSLAAIDLDGDGDRDLVATNGATEVRRNDAAQP